MECFSIRLPSNLPANLFPVHHVPDPPDPLPDGLSKTSLSFEFTRAMLRFSLLAKNVLQCLLPERGRKRLVPFAQKRLRFPMGPALSNPFEEQFSPSLTVCIRSFFRAPEYTETGDRLPGRCGGSETDTGATRLG